MDASGVPPPQQKMRSTDNRHIPSEIMEEILLNLPVKSLLCFSSVSKSWNSTILESGFVKRYRRRAALLGRERIVLVVGDYTIFDETSLISYTSSNNPAVTDFVSPFSQYRVEASCDDMWLVRVDEDESLFLWNPSMRSNYKKAPNPLKSGDYFVFGLGYESVCDDYKILKIPGLYQRQQYEAELYSLRSDSWRIIPHLPEHMHSVIGKCVFVSGKLHWITEDYSSDEDGDGYPFRVSIICFDLLTEKFGEVAHPKFSLIPVLEKEVCVLRGMLCVSIDSANACEIWVMEEYGVAESWTKKFSIPYLNSVFGLVDSIKYIKPLYWYENGEIIVIVIDWSKDTLFVYKDEETRAKEVAIDNCYKTIYTGFVYVDSLVAPTMHAART